MNKQQARKQALELCIESLIADLDMGMAYNQLDWNMKEAEKVNKEILQIIKQLENKLYK